MRLTMERLNQNRRTRSGDRCECDDCKGVFRVYSTHIHQEEGIRVQYLKCNVCNFKPDNTIRVPLEFAPPRNIS